MKKIYIALTLVSLCFSSVFALEKDRQAALWENANNAYSAGNYEDALKGYDSLRNAGFESAKLYYNLGNAYFKTSNIGKAVLYYNRALLLSPNDPDILYNLEIAESHTVDSINEMPVFFAKRWLTDLRMMLSSNQWAVVSLVLFGSALVFVLLYLLSSSLAWRKTGFYAGILLLFLFVCSVTFASRQRTLKLHPGEAIVMSNAIPVKSSPDGGSKDIFILHEGTKVEVLSELNGWREIRIANGDKGWVLSGSIELID